MRPKAGCVKRGKFCRVQRDDAVEIGEFAVDDFADDGRAVALEAYLVLSNSTLMGSDGLFSSLKSSKTVLRGRMTSVFGNSASIWLAA